MTKILIFFSISIIAFIQIGFGQSGNSETLSKQEIIKDLDYLDSQLQELSSYQGLNGFLYKPAFEKYIDAIKLDAVSLIDFGVFLTKTIGRIGDRHSSVKGYGLPGDRYLPFAVAPYNDKVAIIAYSKSEKFYKLLYPKYPFLSSINGTPINDFISKVYPEEIKAPKQAYFNRAVGQLKNIEECYNYFGEKFPAKIQFTLSGKERDTTIVMQWASRKNNKSRWYEKFRKFACRRRGELNDTVIAKKHFIIGEDNIAYIHIPRMAYANEAPIYFNELNGFMKKIKSSKSLIMDIRSNTGGGRDLIFELAKYFVHPDSIYVVNVARQRCEPPLNDNRKEELNHRYLYSMDELNVREKKAVEKFLNSFEPMYELPKDKFSEYHFTVFNGREFQNDGYFYDKPIYILMDERSFSAASVFAAVFKGLPNIKLAGVTTDGSSGNSETFELPYSKLGVKVSTMVSFQKNGKILDGYGTPPDIEIKRSLKQALWQEDYQLEKLKKIISKKN